jgi:hypothetical protein
LGLASGQSYQTWILSGPDYVMVRPPYTYLGHNLWLTSNSGSHAVAMQEYYSEEDECYRTWVSVVARRNRMHDCIATAEYDRLSLIGIADTTTIKDEDDLWSKAPSVALNPDRKHAAWGRNMAGVNKGAVLTARTGLTNVINDWPWTNLIEDDHAGWQGQITVETQRSDNVDYVYVAYIDSFMQGGTPWLRLVCARSADNGSSWANVQVDAWPYFTGIKDVCGNPSIAVEQGGTDVYLVYEYQEQVYFRRSTDNGQNWGSAVDLSYEDGGKRPCVAALGDHVFVAWEFAYRWSDDGGGAWSPDINEEPEELLPDVPWIPTRLNLSMVRVNQQGNARENLLLVCAADVPGQHYKWTSGVAFVWAGHYTSPNSYWLWSAPTWQAWRGGLYEQDTLFCPSVAAYACPRTSGGPDYDTAGGFRGQV